MKVLYTTDLHGNLCKYRTLIPLAKEIGANVVVNGGDMLPTNNDLHFNQNRFLSEFLDDFLACLQELGIIFIGFLGNDDLRVFDTQFANLVKKYHGVFNIAQSRINLEGFEFIGMNWVLDYPFRLKDRCRIDSSTYELPKQNGDALISLQNGWHRVSNWREYIFSLPSIAQELEGLPPPLNREKAIYVFHMPPSRVGLDQCYDGRKVGSDAIHNFIQEYQPLLTLHGHIHESPEMSGIWKNNINKTVCLQPGQKLQSHLTSVMIDLSNLQSERLHVKIVSKNSNPLILRKKVGYIF